MRGPARPAWQFQAEDGELQITLPPDIAALPERERYQVHARREASRLARARLYDLDPDSTEAAVRSGAAIFEELHKEAVAWAGDPLVVATLGIQAPAASGFVRWQGGIGCNDLGAAVVVCHWGPAPGGGVGWHGGACRYRRGSAAAARSRATDPAASRAEPTAILGLRRCTARAARRTLNTTFGASTAIQSTVSRRGWRRRHGTPMTIPATGKTRSDRRKYRDSRRAVGVSVPAVAGACVPSLRNRSLCHRRMFSCTSARAGASVPRPHATSPKPAAPAHSARARRRRPEAQCPAPTAAWVTTGATGDTHPSVPEGLAPSRIISASRSSGGALLSSPAIPSLSPRRRVCANTRRRREARSRSRRRLLFVLRLVMSCYGLRSSTPHVHGACVPIRVGARSGTTAIRKAQRLRLATEQAAPECKCTS